jgi:hypothetical protein
MASATPAVHFLRRHGIAFGEHSYRYEDRGGTQVGTQPFWPKRGNEVYLAPDTTLMAVDVRPSGGTIVATAPKALFKINADSPEAERLVMGLRAIAVLGLAAIPLNYAVLKRLGWLAVLLTFLLARVFAEGTLMREDLEGTV